MNDAFVGLANGFAVALQTANLGYALIGVSMGMLVGVMPGLGPSATIALLLPATFQLPPVSAIIMLSGIYYGAMYGSSTTSILLNVPGEPSSVVTCLDGYQMARKGRAGPALSISAFASFIAGTIAVIGLTIVAALVSEWALAFGPPEYFSLLTMALVVVTFLSRSSIVSALIMVTAGIIAGSVGLDPITAAPRLTFGQLQFADGLALTPLVMGLFGLGEVFNTLGGPTQAVRVTGPIGRLMPTREDWNRSVGAIGRGTGIGFFLGVLPGVGNIVPQFLSYAAERRLSRRPDEFGAGAIEGVAAPEACNNAATVGTFIPLLSLGAPSNAITAMLLGSLMVSGLTPGPLLIQESPDVFWGLIASMYIGNVILLVLSVPLIPLWVQIVRIPPPFLAALIVLFSLVGAYSLNNSTTDMFIALVFGCIGFLMRRLGYEPAVFVLAFVIGALLETALRRSLILSAGDPSIFITRPLSAVFIGCAIALLAAGIMSGRRFATRLPADD